MQQLRNVFQNKSILFLIALILISTISVFAATKSQQFSHIFSNSKQVSPSKNETNPSLEQVLGESNSNLWLTVASQGENYWGYSNGGLLSLSSEQDPTLTLSGYGDVPKSVKITLFKVNKGDLLGYLLHDEEKNKLVSKLDTSSLEKVTEFNEKPRKDGTTFSLPLSDTGIWFLTVENEEGKSVATSMIVRSNLGALVKEGDSTYFFWVQAFDSLRSQADASVTTYNLTNSLQTLSSTTTNSQGIAETAYTENADIALVEQGDDLTVVPINLTSVNVGYFYNRFPAQEANKKFFVFTDRPIYQPGDTVYFKSIIRNDDDAVYTPASGTARVMLYKGWNDTVVYEKNYPLSSNGSLDGNFEIPENSGTGYYRVTVEMGENHSSYASFSVENYRKPEYSLNVSANETEYISGDTIELDVTGAFFSGQPLAHQNVQYKIYSSNYYQYGYYTEDLPLLSDDYRYGYWYGRQVDSGTVELNERGIAKISSKTLSDVSENITSDKVYSVEVSYIDESGNPVLARKNILVREAEFSVYRKDYYSTAQIGGTVEIPLKLVPHDQSVAVSQIPLEVTGVVTQYVKNEVSGKQTYRKETHTLDAISLTSNNKGEATIRVKADRPGSYNFTMLTKDARDNVVKKEFYAYVYDSNTPYSELQQNSFDLKLDKETYKPGESAQLSVYSQLGKRDVLLTFLRDRVRRYEVIRLENNSTQVELPILETDMPNVYLTADSFSKNGLNNSQVKIPVSTESKKMHVELISDRDTYGPGDTVTVTVKTTNSSGQPIAGELALWTVDKSLYELASDSIGSIFDTFWKERYESTNEGNSLEGIVSNAAERGGGCFVGETEVLLADGTSKQIKDVKVGEKVLTRKSEDNPELVSAEVTDIHKATVPGYLIFNSTMKVTPEHRLFVNGSWKVAGDVMVGDTILDVQNNPVSIVSIEWQAGAVKVYNLTVATYQTYFANNIYVHNQKGDARTTFADTAYWNPVVRTDTTGEAKVTFTLPDNLTTWVITGLGATNETVVGQSTLDIQVSKDIVVRPIVPDVLREGDTIQLSALVHNFTDSEETFLVSLEGKKLDFNSNPLQEVTIPGADFAQVFWEVTVGSENHDHTVLFSAKNKNNETLSDSIQHNLPVQAFGFMNSYTRTGIGGISYDVALSPSAHAQKSSISLHLSPSIVGTLPAAMQYLIDYPYGCVEQTTSRFVPLVLALQHPDIFASALATVDSDKMIESGLTRLAKLQNEDGAWGWWGGNSDPYISAYVLEYLLRAESIGISVDSTMLSNARRYFRENTSTEVHELIVTQYALSLMNETKNTKEIDVSRLSAVDADYVALAVLANIRNGFKNPKTNGLDLLLSLAHKQGDVYSWSTNKNWGFHSSEAATGLALRALLEAGGYQNVVIATTRNAVETRTANRWGNTYGTAQMIRVITDVSRYLDETNPKYTYTVLLNGEEVSTGTVNSSKESIKPLVFSGEQLSNKNPQIEIRQQGQGQLYSTLLVDDFVTDRDQTAVSNGISITRSYNNITKPGYSFSVGDIVNVKLTVSGLQADQQYLVIEDHLPSGLIPINSALLNQKDDGYRTHYYGFYSGGIVREFTKDGVIFSDAHVNQLHANSTKTYTYRARVINAGTFTVPPATTSLMYVPDTNAHTAVETISVNDTRVYIGTNDNQEIVRTKKNTTLGAVKKWLSEHPMVALFLVIALGTGVCIIILKRDVIRTVVGRLLQKQNSSNGEVHSDDSQEEN